MDIIEQIRKNAQTNPERIAFARVDSSGVQEQICWKQLWDFSGALAQYIDSNTRTKNPIMVYGHKSPYMIVSFIASIRSGKAYCPVDISMPFSRVKNIKDQLDAELILATEEIKEVLNGSLGLDDIKSICREKLSISENKRLEKDETAYIIFTSGSTGLPKGVMIALDALNNFLTWALGLVSDNKDNAGLPKKAFNYLNQAPYSFDLSVMDTYLSLSSGGTIYAIDSKLQANFSQLMTELKKLPLEIWVSTPSFAELCLADKDFNSQSIETLQAFLFCGEPLSKKTVSRLLNRFPDVMLYNTYGPTESTVAITDIMLDKESLDLYENLPVGYPKEGTYIEILDEQGSPLKDGEKGEIVIIGDTVGQGYWKDKEKTDRAFSKKTINGVTFPSYRTGDAGYLKDGLLYCSGRIDLQIKMHGYRLEIEDIENNLLDLKYISNVCVCPVYRRTKIASLTAVYVLNKNYETDDDFRDRVRKDLADQLPEYMIPKKFIEVDKLPLTNNGKLDRKKIQELIS